jgi:four helix bundle protein
MVRGGHKIFCKSAGRCAPELGPSWSELSLRMRGTGGITFIEGAKTMRPHQNLQAWSQSVELVTTIYRTTERFPREERYGLTSQIRRAAVSIPANIAEGAGRRSPKEFAYFLSNSQGSASELETELIIANNLGYLDETNFAQLISELERIGRLITGLSRSASGPKHLSV